MQRRAVTLAALFVVGCATAAEPVVKPTPTALPPAVAPSLATCSGTLKGAIATTFTCDVTARDEADGTHFRITPRGEIPGVGRSVLADYVFTKGLRIGRYEDETRPGGVSRLEDPAGKVYAADQAVDAVIITIDALERYRAGGRVTVMGSLQATLKPADAAGKAVVLDVRF